MRKWQKSLKFDPLPAFSDCESPALQYFVRRDLLAEAVEGIEKLWQLHEVEAIFKKQLDNGAWKYPGGGREHLRSIEDYNQLETYRQLGLLVEKYGLSRQHPRIEDAANYLFCRQTSEWDFRGIYGNQYSPNYSAAIMELLIKAGYEDDTRIKRGFSWLLSIRQDDGGWAIPLRTRGQKFYGMALSGECLQPDRSKPFSHLVTGIVLRAFAAHESYRCWNEAKTAAYLLTTRFFKPDNYTDRKAVSFWTAFSFPFWQTDLISSLDTLSLMAFHPNEAHIAKALDWLISRQQSDGLWHLHLLRAPRESNADLWLSLAICRIFKRFFQ